MKKLTANERAALISHISDVLQEYEEHGGIGWGEWVYRIALASLRAEPAPSAPDGWKLVPVKATAEIIQAGIEAHYYRQVTQQPELEEFVGPMESAYNAMLAAAPGGE